MTLGQASARLILASVVLIAAGCASQSSQFRTTKSGDEILPARKPAQLLAAARQYEKEGRTDLAIRYYGQLLALDPGNAEAHDGLRHIHSGQPRTRTNYQEIIASSEPNARPHLRAAEGVPQDRTSLDERTAQLIADAAARATTKTASQAGAGSAAEPIASTTVAARGPVPPRTPPSVASSPANVPNVDAPLVRCSAVGKVSANVQSAAREVVNLEVIAVVAEDHEPTEHASRPEPPAAVPTDWDDNSPWQTTSLVRLCHDANAAVLREVARLDSKDPETRQEGLHALARMGPDAAAASLAVRMLFYDSTELVRAHAAWTIWELTADTRTAVPLLIELLDSTDADVVQFAAYTLSKIGDGAAAALPGLHRLVESSEDPLIRLHAIEAMTKIAPESELDSAMDALIMLTAESRTDVRTLAILALGQVGQPPTASVTTALTSGLHDSDPEVRAASALSLGGFGASASSAVVQLEFVAQNDQLEVKQAAAAALECIRGGN